MSSPKHDRSAEIACSMGIAVPTLYRWRHRWQKEVKLLPASGMAPEQWIAADMLAVMIQATALSCTT